MTRSRRLRLGPTLAILASGRLLAELRHHTEGGTDELANIVTLCARCHGQPGHETRRATVDRAPGESWL
jgi:cytochrome c553